MAGKDLGARNAALAQKIGDKLGIGGSGLAGKMRRAGRRLPRRLRRGGAFLVEAETLAGHPKLARRVDLERVEKVHADYAAHLKGIDPDERRMNSFLRGLAVVVFNLLLFAALLIGFLAWRGDIGLG